MGNRRKLEVIEGITLDVVTGGHELGEPVVRVGEVSKSSANDAHGKSSKESEPTGLDV